MSNAVPAAYLEAEIEGQAQRFALPTGRVLRIGRNRQNDVVLNDNLIGRNHAMLQQSGDGLFYITDLGSRNGTFVNGVRLAGPVTLRPADRVGIGNHEFIFHQPAFADCAPGEPHDALQSTKVQFSESLITVLVADIRGFTGLCQQIDAATLSKLTGTLFREVGKELQARGAWAQKYIGDAVMAVWVHKRRGPDLCELIAVFEGLERMAAIAASLQAPFGLAAPLRFGVGINTGSASLGNAGSIASSDFTALGETVNRAFRLESSTKEISRDIVIGRATYDLLNRTAAMGAYFTAVTVQLKGYDELATAYAVDLASIPSLLGDLRATAIRA